MNSNPCGVDCFGYSQTFPYHVPYTYHFDGNCPGSYLVQLGDGSVVLVTVVATACTYRDQQTVSTRFRKNKKKRGYLNACHICIRKHGKHHNGKENAGKIHHIKILLDEYLPSNFRKMGMRCSYKRSNLCGTSLFQKDVVDNAVQEGEEETREQLESENDVIEGERKEVKDEDDEEEKSCLMKVSIEKELRF